MPRYKLIVVAGEERRTGEYENVVQGMNNAEKKAKILLSKWIKDYPDTYIACYPYNEDINMPIDDYNVWVRDVDGIEYWRNMKVSVWGHNLYMY